MIRTIAYAFLYQLTHITRDRNALTHDDRGSRRFGSVLVGVFGFIYFALLDTKVPALMFIAIALSLLPVMTWSPATSILRCSSPATIF